MCSSDLNVATRFLECSDSVFYRATRDSARLGVLSDSRLGRLGDSANPGAHIAVHMSSSTGIRDAGTDADLAAAASVSDNTLSDVVCSTAVPVAVDVKAKYFAGQGDVLHHVNVRAASASLMPRSPPCAPDTATDCTATERIVHIADTAMRRPRRPAGRRSRQLERSPSSPNARLLPNSADAAKDRIARRHIDRTHITDSDGLHRAHR